MRLSSAALKLRRQKLTGLFRLAVISAKGRAEKAVSYPC